MTWRHVCRRDLMSVYRSRTGTAVAALLGLSTAVVTGLMALGNDFVLVTAVVALILVGAIVTLVFVGSPRAIALLVIGFTVAAIGVTTALAPSSPPAQPDTRTAVLVLSTGLSLVVPLVALLGSYAALVGERETGSIRFLLGLPNSRDDAFVGKLVSRAAIVLVPLVTGVALAGVVVGLRFDGGSVVSLLGLAAVSVPYALLFVGIGLTASAYADTSNRAVAVVIAVFVLFRAGWSAFEWLLIHWAGEPDPLPAWFFWIDRFNPINAYLALSEGAMAGPGHPLLVRPAPPIAPIATSDTFAIGVLLLWMVMAPLGGVLYFRRRDLL